MLITIIIMIILLLININNIIHSNIKGMPAKAGWGFVLLRRSSIVSRSLP